MTTIQSMTHSALLEILLQNDDCMEDDDDAFTDMCNDGIRDADIQ